MEHHMSEPWLLNFEIAYDSGFQNGPNVSPMLPVNSAWRFGVGAQDVLGVAAGYSYGTVGYSTSIRRARYRSH
jgi:hypothetical protein